MCLKWDSKISLGEVLAIVIAGIAVWIAFQQNKISDNATTVAKQALQHDQEGDKTDDSIAQSLRETAVATNSVACATNSVSGSQVKVAEANSKTAEATQKAADAAERALAVSNQANEIAGRAAKAAEESVKLAEASLNLASQTTVSQLRAYVTVVGTDLRFDEKTRTMIATVVMENTGLTPAHNIVFLRDIACAPTADDFVFVRPLNNRPSPYSLGPRAKFQTQLSWRLEQGVTPAMFDAPSKMSMWIFGTVQYDCAFSHVPVGPHQTNFALTQGERIGNVNRWQLVIDPRGLNDSN